MASQSAVRRATREQCVQAYYLQRTRFERIVKRKLRQRQLTDDENIEISGRGPARENSRPPSTWARDGGDDHRHQ